MIQLDLPHIHGTNVKDTLATMSRMAKMLHCVASSRIDGVTVMITADDDIDLVLKKLEAAKRENKPFAIVSSHEAERMQRAENTGAAGAG